MAGKVHILTHRAYSILIWRHGAGSLEVTVGMKQALNLKRAWLALTKKWKWILFPQKRLGPLHPAHNFNPDAY